MEEYRLTQEGYNHLDERLKELRKERIRFSRRLRDVRYHGSCVTEERNTLIQQRDLLDSEMTRIREILDNAEIIETPTGSGDVVELFSNFIIKDVEKDNILGTYKLVPRAMVDLETNKISPDCPVGRAIYGKRVGEEVTVVSETGKTFRYAIEGIV